ncbi:unnamed protein product, partial [Rotaria sp. Silwood2]
IEPTANATESMQGSYFGKAPFLIDPVTAIKAMTAAKLIDVEFVNGCKIKDPDESGFSAVIELARLAGILIFFGGLDQSIEDESVDHTSITVPDIQLSLIHQLEKVVRLSIHVVIMSGSGLDLTYIRDSTQFGSRSLIWMGYAGQSDGLAISNVVFDQYNPGGRLPITMYSASYVDDVTVNQTKEIFFPLTVRHLLTIARDGTKWLHPGSYDVLIGQQHMHTLKLYGQSIQWALKRHVFPSNESN